MRTLYNADTSEVPWRAQLFLPVCEWACELVAVFAVMRTVPTQLGLPVEAFGFVMPILSASKAGDALAIILDLSPTSYITRENGLVQHDPPLKRLWVLHSYYTHCIQIRSEKKNHSATAHHWPSPFAGQLNIVYSVRRKHDPLVHMTLAACCENCFGPLRGRLRGTVQMPLQMEEGMPADATTTEQVAVALSPARPPITHEVSNLSERVRALELQRRESHRLHGMVTDAPQAHALGRATVIASEPSREVSVCFLCSSNALNTTRILDNQTRLAETLLERLNCIICCTRQRDTILMPCRHALACQLCASKLETCPVCRTAIEHAISYFVP
jgi:hypothetical protein